MAAGPGRAGTYSQVGALTLVAVANTFNIGADLVAGAAAAGLLLPVPHTPPATVALEQTS